MNKNLKKIIALTIICTAISSVIPSTLSIGYQNAYAYSDDKISDLKIASGVSGVPFYSSRTFKSDYRIKTGDTIPIIIYSKISSEKSNIKISSLQTGAADTRIFVGSSYVKIPDIYSQINIEKGEKKSIYIRLYDSKSAADDSYTNEYELILERENGDDVATRSSEEQIVLKEYGNIYLTSLAVYDSTQKFDLTFNKTQPIYNLNVPENVGYVTIKAVPEKESYKLRIDDKVIDTNGSNDDKNKRQVTLFKGENIIKIRIISDEHETREYFLIITRGQSKTTTTAASNATSENTTSTNTQTYSGWQYRKSDGTYATGWQFLNNNWYYFDTDGIMKTGWFKDANGKWYYLNSSGAMVKNTTIDGYKINSDGVYMSIK